MDTSYLRTCLRQNLVINFVNYISMAKIIAVVEDDKFLRELISQKLIKEGYEVFGAVDGEEGLQIVKSKKPDLILLDLILPGMDGFEVLENLKKDPETSPIPVIVLSNLDQKEDMEKIFKLGAADFLIKARSTPGEVVDKVREILR